MNKPNRKEINNYLKHVNERLQNDICCANEKIDYTFQSLYDSPTSSRVRSLGVWLHYDALLFQEYLW